MSLVPVNFKQEFLKYQRELVLDLSRPITVGFDSDVVEECPNCFFDQMTNSSSAVYNTEFTGTKTIFAGTSHERVITAASFKHVCPACRGKGIFTIPNEKIIQAHVIWELKQVEPVTPIGISPQDLVSIKADSRYYNDFVNAKYFIVDGRRLVTRDYPIRRGMGMADGIVEIVCATEDSSKEIK